jgi:hypothetical protein
MPSINFGWYIKDNSFFETTNFWDLPLYFVEAILFQSQNPLHAHHTGYLIPLH